MQIICIIWDIFPDLAANLHEGGVDQRLNPNDFVSRVLVPEAARLLIKEDLNLSDEEALDILARSRAYGVALHPDVDLEDW